MTDELLDAICASFRERPFPIDARKMAILDRLREQPLPMIDARTFEIAARFEPILRSLGPALAAMGPH